MQQQHNLKRKMQAVLVPACGTQALVERITDNKWHVVSSSRINESVTIAPSVIFCGFLVSQFGLPSTRGQIGASYAIPGYRGGILADLAVTERAQRPTAAYIHT